MIDPMAEWARSAGRGGGPAGDFITRLRKSKPLGFLSRAIRVIDDTDFEKTILFAAGQLMNGVGPIAYEHTADGIAYGSALSCKS